MLPINSCHFPTWIYGISISRLPPALPLPHFYIQSVAQSSRTSDLCFTFIFIFPSPCYSLCQAFICSSWIHCNSFFSHVCPPNEARHLAQLIILSLSPFHTITLFEMFFWLHIVSRIRSAILSHHKLTPTYFSRFIFTLLNFQSSPNSRSLHSWTGILAAFSCFLILMLPLFSASPLPPQSMQLFQLQWHLFQEAFRHSQT